MTAWKVDDKEWMKQRKAAWKDVKRKIACILNVSPEERRTLKDYYLFGKEDPELPLSKVHTGPLFELWLCPDRSEEHWKIVKEKYTDRQRSNACNEFVTVNMNLKEYAPDGGSFFDGLEERLCRWFGLDRLRREDWPAMNDDQFRSMAKDRMLLVIEIQTYLTDEFSNVFDITRYLIPKWRDALMIAYEQLPELKPHFRQFKSLAKTVKDILDNPNAYNDVKVSMAKEIRDLFSDKALPDQVIEFFGMLKKDAGWKE